MAQILHSLRHPTPLQVTPMPIEPYVDSSDSFGDQRVLGRSDHPDSDVRITALMLATVWLDVIFVPLFVAGVETIETVSGARGGYGTGIIHADYTHSVPGALVIAGVFGLIAAIPWGRRPPAGDSCVSSRMALQG